MGANEKLDELKKIIEEIIDEKIVAISKEDISEITKLLTADLDKLVTKKLVIILSNLLKECQNVLNKEIQ